MGAKLFENFLGTLRWTLHKPCTDLVQILRGTLFKCCPPQIVADTCVLTSFPKMSKMKNHCTVLCIQHSWKIENQSPIHMIFWWGWNIVMHEICMYLQYSTDEIFENNPATNNLFLWWWWNIAMHEVCMICDKFTTEEIMIINCISCFDNGDPVMILQSKPHKVLDF